MYVQPVRPERILHLPWDGVIPLNICTKRKKKHLRETRVHASSFRPAVLCYEHAYDPGRAIRWLGFVLRATFGGSIRRIMSVSADASR